MGEGYHIYKPVNPIKPEVAVNLNQPPKRSAAVRKEGIARRLVIPYDIDVERPKGQAASDEELRIAHSVVQNLVDDWRKRGITPQVKHSGNGWQLEVPIDLPNDAASEDLVKKVLETHKAAYDIPGAHIDCWKDANRTFRVPGYKNWKGDNSSERPHRTVKLLNEASGLATREMLEEVAKGWVKRSPSPSSATARATGKADQDALAVLKGAYLRTGRVWTALKAARKQDLKLNGDHSTICEFANFLNNSWQEMEGTNHDGIVRVLETIWDECGTSADGGRTPSEVEDIVVHAFAKDRKPWDIPEDPPYAAGPGPIGLVAFRDDAAKAEWIAKNIDVLDIKPKLPADPQKDAEWFSKARDLVSKELPPQRILASTADGTPLLRSSFLMELFAFRGVGKSAVAMGFAKLLLKGGEFLDYRSEGGATVLYVDGELPLILLQDRIKTFIGDHTENLWFMSAEQLPDQTFPALIDPAVQAMFEERVDRLKPDVIILDTLSAVGKFDTNDSEAWRIFNGFLLRLRFKGYCVILVHHAGKNGTQRGRTDAEDNIDLVMQLTPPEGHDPGDGLKACVSYTKVRYGRPPAELRL